MTIARSSTVFGTIPFPTETADLLDQAGFPAEQVERRRPRRPSRAALPALMAADTIAIGSALVVGQLIARLISHRGSVPDALASVVYTLVYLVVMSGYGLYRRGRRRLVASSFPDISHLVHSLLVASLATIVVSGPLHRLVGLPLVNRTATLAAAVLAVAGVPSSRAVVRWTLRHRSSSGSKLLIVGSGVVASRVVARLAKVDGVTVVGCVDDNQSTGAVEDVPLLGGLDSVPELVETHGVDHIVVAFSPVSGAKLAGQLRLLASDVQISIVPRLFDLLTVRSHVDDLYGLPVVDVAPASLGPMARLTKRAMDVTAASIGLLVMAPALCVIALAVRLTSPGPIFYRQERSGRGGEAFSILKFRTMHRDAEELRLELTNDVDGPLFKSHDDPRVTGVGRLLRKTSLDELPQFINVLRGDMSLVGPRPFVTSESAQIEGWAARRFDVRPGMTGLWQVSGRNDLPFDELCRLDYSYVASWSLWWDVRILWHTPAMVFRRHGAY